MSSLELSEITVERGGRPVVKDVSISVPAGQATALLGPHAARVAIAPEVRRLLPDLSVDDNLKVATYTLTKQAAAEGRARALELFPRLGQRLTVQARLLSGGEQQMVVLAQALVSQPKFILIDELSLGLAPVIVNQLIPVIRSLF